MTLGEAIAYYEENEPRGEFVLVVAGADKKAEEGPTLEDCLSRVAELREKGMSLKDAVKMVSKDTGFAKNELYDAALKK